MKALLFIILLPLFSCASESSVPMENRKYDFCVNSKNEPTCDGFCYQDNVCVKRVVGICVNREIRVVDKIPLKIEDKAMCEKFFNMNFIFQVREKPI